VVTPSHSSRAALAVGVDVGGTKVLGRVLDPADDRAALVERRVDTPRGGEAMVDAIADVVAALADDPVVRAAGDVQSIGVGVPGLMDEDGVLRFAPNLPGVVEYPVQERLSQRLGQAVAVDNDANCATWCEFRLGAARGATDAVLVTLGTGIGAGIVTDGRPNRGAHGFAGEPGHKVIDPNGPPCPCGRRGCWERFASGSGLGRLGRDAAAAGRAPRVMELAGGDAEAVRGEHVTSAALDGDAEAIAIMREFARWFAVGVANLVDILDPDVVVVGGGLADVDDLFLAPARVAFAELVLAHDHRPAVPIVPARFGPEAGSIGAALLARDHP
jgi:glucokinase